MPECWQIRDGREVVTEGEQGPESVRELATSRIAREEGEASDALPSWLKVVGSGD
jgi:hypothetical protein